jgi:hypothetical protein
MDKNFRERNGQTSGTAWSVKPREIQRGVSEAMQPDGGNR